MTRLRTLRFALWGLVGLAVVAAAGLWSLRPWDPAVPTAGEGEALVGGPFELVDGRGETVTAQDLTGRPFVIFFGFTHCPDICPTSLFEMSQWIEALGPAADRMRFAFVTVDPQRDTPAVMRDYVAAFSDRIIPLTGTAAQVEQVLDAYRVYAEKVPLEGGGYTMDHSAFVYLMDARGRYVTHIAYGEDSERAVAKLRELAAGA
ncbi:MAG: redoxin domain-containing protein [Alphaproteobacteria bacterium]|jgi:protein SCO1/2|nr:redoxin domain-containing protein [Alphaproteobacteria bacterium]